MRRSCLVISATSAGNSATISDAKPFGTGATNEASCGNTSGAEGTLGRESGAAGSEATDRWPRLDLDGGTCPGREVWIEDGEGDETV
jgi:hypothetical protein